MKEIQFQRRACPNCRGNVYQFVVQEENGPRVINLPPDATVSELQNRI